MLRIASSPEGGAFAIADTIIFVMKLDIVPKKHCMLPIAREFRRNMTPQEAKLWYQFLRHYPVKVYKQRIIEAFIADFYCSKAMLVIEVDGVQHFSEQGQAYDLERSAVFAEYGIQVLRFSNTEVQLNFDAVCAEIDRSIQSRL